MNGLIITETPGGALAVAGPRGRLHLRPHVRRPAAHFRRHAGHQFRAGRAPDARHVCALYLFGWLGLGQLFGPYLGPVVAALLGAGRPVSSSACCCIAPCSSRVTGMRVAGTEGEGHYPQLILTLGLSLIIANGGLILFGSTPQNIRTPLSASRWELGPLLGNDLSVFLNKARSVACIVSVLVAIGLYLFINRSRVGKSLRAAADNPEAATYMGIDVDAAHRVAFALGTAHHRDRRRPGRHLLSVPALCRSRVRHHHVCRRRARRIGQHRRRVLGRHHHRTWCSSSPRSCCRRSCRTRRSSSSSC